MYIKKKLVKIPELGSLFNFETAFGAATYTSAWVNVQSYCSITFTAWADVNYTMELNWSTTDVGVSIHTDSTSVLANGSESMYHVVKARYVQIHMIFASNPANWKTQFFFCLDDLGLSSLQNVGGGAESFIPANEIRTFTSTDSTVGITQGTSTIDLSTAVAANDLNQVLSNGNITGGVDISMTGGSCLSSTGDLCISANGGAGTVNLDGALVVSGDITSVDAVTLSVADSAILLNSGYKIPSVPKACYICNMYQPTANVASVNGNFTPGVLATSDATVETNNGYTFTAGQIVQVEGANEEENDGLYEVKSYTNPTLTLKGQLTANTFPFFSTNVISDTVIAGEIRVMEVSSIRNESAAGEWEKSNVSSDTASLTFSEIGGSKSYLQTISANYSAGGTSGFVNTAHTASSSSGDWDLTTAGQIKYTGTKTRRFHFLWRASNINYTPLLYVQSRKNDVLNGTSETMTSSEAIDGIAQNTNSWIHELATNDYVRYSWVQSGGLSLQYIQCTVIEI